MGLGRVRTEEYPSVDLGKGSVVADVGNCGFETFDDLAGRLRRRERR